VSVQTLRRQMTAEFTSKGSAIANSLASSGVDLILTRDASTVQALIDQFAGISGVAYVMVYDTARTRSPTPSCRSCRRTWWTRTSSPVTWSSRCATSSTPTR